MDARSRRGLTAALEVGAEHGVRSREPRVLRDRANLLVHLAPAPVVARIATQTGTVRLGDAWLTREVAIAAHLAAQGAFVVPPSRELPPGPHHRDGFTLSFWTFEAEAGPVDAAAAGRALRDCHDLLRAFPGALARFGALTELVPLLDGLEHDGVLDAAAATAARTRAAALLGRVEALALPEQPLHGDAHLGNVLQTSRGPLWNDWEDAFTGPRLWDVACLLAFPRPGGREPELLAAAVHGYGIDDSPELEVLTAARRFQGTVWSAVLGAARGDAGQVATAVSALEATG